MPSDAASTSMGAQVPATPPLIPDHHLFHRIGRGAYGDVWLAESALGTRRAVKIVYRARFEEPRPFERELEGIRRYEPISRTHEGLLDILQVGPPRPVDHFYYVMELADEAGHVVGSSTLLNETGRRPAADNSPTTRPDSALPAEAHGAPSIANGGIPPASQRVGYVPHTLRCELQSRGRLPILECARIGSALSDGVAHLHRHGLVHRDIKPSNIVYVGGVPKLADIGLVTGTGEARTYVGTPGYMPPEGPGTEQGDIYSLGKLLYEIGSGKSAQEFPEPPPGLGRETEDAEFADFNLVVVKACEANPNHRYRTVLDLQHDLSAILTGRSVRRLRMLESHVALLRRFLWVAGAAAVLAVGALYLQRAHTRQVERLSAQNRQQLVKLHVAAGIRLMDNGDLMASLPWFVEALHLDAGDIGRERMHRYRIEAIRRECPQPIQMGMHGGPIHSSEFSPDETRVLTASEDGTAGIWDVETGERLAVLTHHGSVLHATHDPQGRLVATASADGTARLWDARTGQPVLAPFQHQSNVVQVAFSPDSSLVASASWDGTVQVRNVATGQPAYPALKHADRVVSVVFSPDGQWLASGSVDKTVRLWAAKSGEPLHEPLVHLDEVICVAFSPDSQRLLTAGHDGYARVWSVSTGQTILPPLQHSDLGAVWHATFDRDARRILSAGGRFNQSGEVNLWDAVTGERLAPSLRFNLPVRWAAFSPDGRRVALGCLDGLARICDAATMTSIIAPLHQQLAIWTARFSSDGSRVLTSGRDGSWHLWDLVTDAAEDPVSVQHGRIESLVPSPNGSLIAHTDSSLVTRVWGAQSLEPITPILESTDSHVSFSPDGRRLLTVADDRALVREMPGGTILRVLPHGSKIIQTSFSPDGTRVATAALDGSVRLWALEGEEQALVTLNHPKSVSTFDFSTDGRLLATGTANPGIVYANRGEVRVWDVNSGRLLWGPFALEGAATSVDLSPDGRWLAAACGDISVMPHVVRVWGTASWSLACDPIKNSDGTTKVRFSPDSRRLLTATEDGVARVWTVPEGMPVTPHMRHSRGLVDACFSPDGKLILTGCPDGSSRVWDASTGEPLTPALRHRDRISAIAFESQNQWPITGSWDRSVRIWRIVPTDRTPQDLAVLAEALSGAKVSAARAQVLERDDWHHQWQEYRALFQQSLRVPRFSPTDPVSHETIY